MNNQDFLMPKPYKASNGVMVTQEVICEMTAEFESLETRKDIQEYGEYIDNLPDSLGEDPFPLFHKFSDGLYSREIHMPRGHVVISKIHKKQSQVFLIKGKLLVKDEHGLRIIEGPQQFVSDAGYQKAIYVIEDTVWMDVHATDETTIEDAEKDIYAKSYTEIKNIETDEVITVKKSEIIAIEGAA